MLPHQRTLPTLPHLSGVIAIRGLDPVVELVETIERLVEEGRGLPYFMVEVFRFMSIAHWSAIAKEAGVPTPSPAVIEAVIASYKKRVGYEGSTL